MARFKVKSGFCVRPGVDVYPGDVLELAGKEAIFPKAKGWIEPTEEEEYIAPPFVKPPKAGTPADLASRVTALEAQLAAVGAGPHPEAVATTGRVASRDPGKAKD